MQSRNNVRILVRNKLNMKYCFILSLANNDHGFEDECSNPYSVCGLDSVCQNSPGSFRCTCKAGFRRNSNDKCVDLNECTTIPGRCSHNEIVSGTVFIIFSQEYANKDAKIYLDISVVIVDLGKFK